MPRPCVCLCVRTHTRVRVFTCIVNVRRYVFDSVYMCACVCMRFLVVACNDVGMYDVCLYVYVCRSVCGCT